MKTDTPTFIDYFADLSDPRIEDRSNQSAAFMRKEQFLSQSFVFKFKTINLN